MPRLDDTAESKIKDKDKPNKQSRHDEVAPGRADDGLRSDAKHRTQISSTDQRASEPSGDGE